MNRLQHDTAVAIAQACLDVVASCVHPSCHKDAWEAFYELLFRTPLIEFGHAAGMALAILL